MDGSHGLRWGVTLVGPSCCSEEQRSLGVLSSLKQDWMQKLSKQELYKPKCERGWRSTRDHIAVPFQCVGNSCWVCLPAKVWVWEVWEQQPEALQVLCMSPVSLQRLVVCLEESIYIHNIKDMKLLKTIMDTPPNTTGEHGRTVGEGALESHSFVRI